MLLWLVAILKMRWRLWFRLTIRFWLLYVSIMYFCYRKPPGVPGSCWTRMPGWSNSRVYRTDAMADWCSWEHWQKLCMNKGGLVTTWGASVSARNDPGSANDQPGSIWMHRQQTWEHLKLLNSSLRKTSSLLGMLLVRFEIIATSYHSTIFRTPVFNVYSYPHIYESMYLYSYPSTHDISGLAAEGASEQYEVSLKMTIEWTHRYTRSPS